MKPKIQSCFRRLYAPTIPVEFFTLTPYGSAPGCPTALLVYLNQQFNSNLHFSRFIKQIHDILFFHRFRATTSKCHSKLASLFTSFGTVSILYSEFRLGASPATRIAT